MLSAFFSKGCNSDKLFSQLKIAGWNEYHEHMNQYNVIELNMQKFLSRTKNIEQFIQKLNSVVIDELKEIYPKYCTEPDLRIVAELLKNSNSLLTATWHKK